MTNPPKRKNIMIYRLSIVFLLAILILSTSFNIIHYYSISEMKQTMNTDYQMYSTIIGQMRDRISEIEN